MKKLLIAIAAIAAVCLGNELANAQCCAARCVVGAGRVAAAAAVRPIVAPRARVVYRSYSRGYYAADTCAAYGACGAVEACGPALAPEVAPTPAVEPCAPIETTAPAPCESVGEYKPVKRVETTRRVIRSCPGGLCPLF